eukprot:5761742-Pyramimonas_sp.AAC.2
MSSVFVAIRCPTRPFNSTPDRSQLQSRGGGCAHASAGGKPAPVQRRARHNSREDSIVHHR